jgi:hypothetical protein
MAVFAAPPAPSSPRPPPPAPSLHWRTRGALTTAAPSAPKPTHPPTPAARRRCRFLLYLPAASAPRKGEHLFIALPVARYRATGCCAIYHMPLHRYCIAAAAHATGTIATPCVLPSNLRPTNGPAWIPKPGGGPFFAPSPLPSHAAGNRARALGPSVFGQSSEWRTFL